MTFINTGLIKAPINWITVFLMVLIAGIGIHFIARHYQTVSTQTGIAGT